MTLMHTIFSAATVALLLGLAAPPLVGVARAQEQPQAYVQRMMGEMVAVSKKATAERRTYYVKLLGEDIDWTTPARRALGARFEALAAADRAKLADWSRQSVIGTQSVMEFLQNMIFSSCAVASRSSEGERSSYRIQCQRFGGEPPFQARFEMAPRDGKLKIVDVGYVGVSLSEELAKEIVKPDAMAEHGVKWE
jgi:ABC-type transporter MlaC component